MASGYEQIIWDYLFERIGNEYGVAGLMGNLQAESGLYPDRVQGDVPYSQYSANYTADVDSGVISEYDFVNNGPNGGGYGLAQWTHPSRKQALYDRWESGYPSIGCIDLALEHLWTELQYLFPSVLGTLMNATSIREASDVVLHDFESPLYQDPSVEAQREALGQALYDEFATGINEKKKKKMPLWMMCLRRH